MRADGMSSGEPEAPRWKVGARASAGTLLAVVLIVWIVANRQEVEISFVFGSAEIQVWVALTIAALLGAAVGFLAARRRYK
ncbi:MAG TPA: LapA family protein [Nocardioidaceae bacterium]|nr:LapA family protein [Nocardioidaceae bacterium]